MSSHEESHSNNLHRHFPCIDEQEDEINSINVFCNSIDLLVEGEERTVYKNDEQNESVEPGVN